MGQLEGQGRRKEDRTRVGAVDKVRNGQIQHILEVGVRGLRREEII